MSHQCWYKDRLDEAKAENDQLRSLLWKIARSTNFVLGKNTAIIVEGGLDTLDAIDEAIGYDEMGQ